MIIVIGDKTIPAAILGLVLDERERLNGFAKCVRIFSHQGYLLLELEGAEANTFMAQYSLYCGHLNRQFELGYAATRSYYEQVQTSARTQQEQQFANILAQANLDKPQ